MFLEGPSPCASYTVTQRLILSFQASKQLTWANAGPCRAPCDMVRYLSVGRVGRVVLVKERMNKLEEKLKAYRVIGIHLLYFKFTVHQSPFGSDPGA